MKYSKILLVFTFFFVAITSCDKNFEEINTNPNDPTTVPSGLLIADVVRTSQNISYSTFVGGDMGACWSQQWAKVQYNDEARYDPRESVIESTIWKSMYEDVISDAKTMQELALAEGNNNMQGIGLVLQAYGFQVLTDMFGDIPYSEALRVEEGILSPAYDRQENVYKGILDMLDEADALLDTGGGDINTTSDILYGGDWLGWKKMANSLKFRALMRISAKEDVSARLQEIVNNREVFTSNADEAKLIYLNADPNANPIYETIVFGTRGEFKMNSVMIDKLMTLSDPRLDVYAQKNDASEYRGKPSGIADVPSPDYNYTNVSAIGNDYLEATAPGYFMSYSELQFLMAEAAERGLITGDPATFYHEAIRASFETNGLDAAYADYIAQPSVAYNASEGLKRIGEQNWIGLFCQGVEAWTEWRRTGYPALTPAIEGVISEIPSRYTYPAIEQSVNSANYDAAVAAQGPNLLSTPVWWMN